MPIPITHGNSHRLCSPITCNRVAINPDRTIITNPYYALRASWPNKVWNALAFQCLVWDLHVTGSATSAHSPIPNPFNVSTAQTGSWDFYQRFGMSFGDRREKDLAKVLPPKTHPDTGLPVIQPNQVLWCHLSSALGEIFAGTPNVGPLTANYTNYPFDGDVTGYFRLAGGGLTIHGRNESIDENSDGPLTSGYGRDDAGFGAIFNLDFTLLSSGATEEDDAILQQFRQPPINVTTRPPGIPEQAEEDYCGDLRIEIPDWQNPSTLIGLDIPLYGNFTRLRTSDSGNAGTSSGGCSILMVPYGATTNPEASGNPMTDSNIVLQYSGDIALASATSPADDSRIWNNDLTPHRNPETGALIVP